MLTFVAFIITIGLLVTVHELGHFLAARILGIEVKTFAFGFPPRIWAKKIGKTEYAINALPLGGYVNLKGEEGDATKDPSDKSSLANRTPLEQFFVFVSGVVMNIILAVILFWFVLVVGFQPIFSGDYNYKGITDNRKIIVTQIEKGSPAEKDGIKVNDQILKIDGKKVSQSEEVISIIRAKSGADGAKVTLEISRKGEISDKILATYKSKVNEGGKEISINRVGIIPETKGNVKANPFSAIYIACSETLRISWLTLQGLFELFATIITQFKLVPGVSGPIGIVVATGVFAHMGITYLLQFIAAISISLAIFNILPIPALDGGQIAFTLVEVISRKKFSIKVKNIVQLVGFSLIILLMIIVAVKDINNFDIIGSIKRMMGR